MQERFERWPKPKSALGVVLAALGASACALPEVDPDRYAPPAASRAWTPSPEESLPVVPLPEVPAELEPDLEALTLPQLVDAALRSNPTTAQQWQQARAAAAAWASARGAYSPTVGATLTYTITVEVQNAGVATGSVFSDPIPQYTTFVADSISLNGGNLTDAADLDAGELDTSGTPSVVVRLGDLTQADGVQTVEFQVIID